MSGFRTEAYWENRYRRGHTSGAGSYGRLAEFKAEVINGFVCGHGVASVLELGCGDGNQLRLARYPKYIGFDVSPTAVALCRKLFAGDGSKVFRQLSEYRGETAELSLSLDVIFHLKEESAYQEHMSRLFASSSRYVIIYASDTDEQDPRQAAHMHHHCFSSWASTNAVGWMLLEHVPNRYPAESVSSFKIYGRGE